MTTDTQTNPNVATRRVSSASAGKKVAEAKRNPNPTTIMDKFNQRVTREVRPIFWLWLGYVSLFPLLFSMPSLIEMRVLAISAVSAMLSIRSINSIQKSYRDVQRSATPNP